MSDGYQSLAHSKWDCKYHVVFVPKRRRKVIFGHIRGQLGLCMPWRNRRNARSWMGT
jgi:putative transposase